MKGKIIVSTKKVRKTGGNNVPLVEQDTSVYCIAGMYVFPVFQTEEVGRKDG